MIIRGGQIKYNVGGKEICFAFKTDKKYGNEDFGITFEITKTMNEERYTLIFNPHKEIVIKELYLEGNYKYGSDDRVLSNGFQTWTSSREYSSNDKIKKLNLLAKPIMKQYGDYMFYDYTARKGVINSYTYTSIRNNKNYIFLGSLKEDFAYTVFEHDMNEDTLYIMKDCNGIKFNKSFCAFDILILECEENKAFERYFELSNIKKPATGIKTGWTSWYNYYTKISEDIVIKNINSFAKKNVPIDIFQIDDGYQTNVGDWLSINSKFPGGMKYIADCINKKGYTPGLWIAPFICEKKSKIMLQHPDWILKNAKGKNIIAGFNPNWSGSFYVLDFYNTEVREYLKKVFDTVLNDWGFGVIKLDFLYAVELIVRDGKPRCLIMREAIKFLREISGDKILLGCGVPLGAAFGLVDYCRVGSDISLNWEDNFLKLLNYKERVSTINAITTTIARRNLNRKAFYNDPDVFIIRDKNNKLGAEQRYTLLLINLIFGGLLFTSDNIGEYSEDELDLYLSIFPAKEKKIIEVLEEQGVYNIIFEIGENRYQVICNTSNKTKPCMITSGVLFEKGKFINGSQVIKFNPYESRCFLIIKDKDFAFAGSMNNVFPGAEIDELEIEKSKIKILINEKTMLRKEIYIKVPESLKGYNVNGQICKSYKECELNIIKYIPNKIKVH